MLTDTEASAALDLIEARLHDCGTHALAACVVAGILASNEVSVRSTWRAQAVREALGKGVK